jgi:hypothetical protein
LNLDHDRAEGSAPGEQAASELAPGRYSNDLREDCKVSSSAAKYLLVQAVSESRHLEGRRGIWPAATGG